MKELRKNPFKIKDLKKYDKFNLLKEIKEVKSINDILDNDYLNILDSENEEDIFDFKNIPKNRVKTDFVARRKHCKNFKNYEDDLKKTQKEIKDGKRKLIVFKEHHLREDRYYVLDGIMLYLEKIENSEKKEFNDITQGKRKRFDPRIRCIFENGLESNMYLRSLGKELYNNGATVIQSNEESLEEFSEGFANITDEDKATGHIYVLSSISN